MSYQSQMEKYKNEYQQTRSKMLLAMKITVLALAASILVTGVILGVMLATGGFSTRGGEDGGDDIGASIRGPEGDYVVVYIGDTISYKSFVKLTGGYTLQVDASKVNPKAEGEYTVHYTYGDLTYDLTVYVRQRTFGEAERTKLYEEIARIAKDLAVTPDSNMVLSAKITKIWEYVHDSNTIRYVDRSNIADAHGTEFRRETWENDWEEEAYLTLQSKKGDCYSYYSLSKAFFEYLGIENIGIQRSPSENGTHFWSIVKVGNAWYYYDATRLNGEFEIPGNQALMTEAMLQSYVATTEEKDFYKFEKWDGFPTIATKKVG